MSDQFDYPHDPADDADMSISIAEEFNDELLPPDTVDEFPYRGFLRPALDEAERRMSLGDRRQWVPDGMTDFDMLNRADKNLASAKIAHMSGDHKKTLASIADAINFLGMAYWLYARTRFDKKVAE